MSNFKDPFEDAGQKEDDEIDEDSDESNNEAVAVVASSSPAAPALPHKEDSAVEIELNSDSVSNDVTEIVRRLEEKVDVLQDTLQVIVHELEQSQEYMQLSRTGIALNLAKSVLATYAGAVTDLKQF